MTKEILHKHHVVGTEICLYRSFTKSFIH